MKTRCVASICEWLFSNDSARVLNAIRASNELFDAPFAQHSTYDRRVHWAFSAVKTNFTSAFGSACGGPPRIPEHLKRGAFQRIENVWMDSLLRSFPLD
jgi:hypothetical protein